MYSHKNTLATAVCQLRPLDSRPKALEFHSFFPPCLLLLPWALRNYAHISFSLSCSHLANPKCSAQLPLTPLTASCSTSLIYQSRSKWKATVESAEFSESSASRVVSQESFAVCFAIYKLQKNKKSREWRSRRRRHWNKGTRFAYILCNMPTAFY